MTDGAFDRGDVVWHPAPFKRPTAERPFLILSDRSHPFHGDEYAVVGLTSTERDRAIGLAPGDWAVGSPGIDSYVSPWYLFTIKHADVLRPKGALTSAATTDVAAAVGRVLGVP